jgi:hypothetical protein
MRRSTRMSRPTLSGSSRAAVLLGNDGDGSTLTLDFTTGQLDPRLTFTRSSDATFINSSGLVQWADANHVQNSTMLNNTGTRWTQTTSGGTVTINGDGTVRFNGTGGRATWLQSVGSLASGLPMTFSFRVTSFTNTNLRTTDMFNAGTGFTGQSYFYTDTTGTTHTLTAFESLPKSGTNGVGTYSVTATTNATSANIIFGSDCNNVGGRSGDVTITEPQLQYGTVVPRRVYVPNSSIIAAKWDSPRFDHDPTTLAPRGLLIEGAATNLCLNGSMAYTATAPTSWARGFSGCTVASVNSTTFSGEKAWSISATASGQRDLLEQVISLAANTTYTVSVYLEAVTGTTATFAYMTSLPAGATSGTVVDPSAGRVSFTVTVGATPGSGTVRIGIGSATGTGVSADASVRFSHVQVEAGSGASSYIPTGASAVLRNEDSMTMSSVASLGFDQYQGTFIVRGVQNKHGASFARLLRIAGATTEPFGMPVNGVTLYGTSRNSSNSTIAETTRTNTLGQSFAFGMSLDANDAAAAMKVSLNGSGTSASRGFLGPTEAAASFSFNTNATATNYGCFAVRSVKFFPVTKTLAELNALTT